MAQRYRPAVGVYFCGVETEVAGDGAGLAREGFVGFDHVHVGRLEAGFFQGFLRGGDGPQAHIFRVHAGMAVGDQPRDGFGGFGLRFVHQNECGSAVVEAGGVSRCHRAVFFEGRF